MFSGVLLHGLLSECITRAPTLILGHANYVKKVVFPLESLAWVSVGVALVQAAIATLIFFIAVLFWQERLLWSACLIPILVVPFVFVAAGMVWLIAALGVYFRDLGQFMSIVISLLIFLAPVFYPLAAVPDQFRGYLYLNPITFILEQFRNAGIWGDSIDWGGWALYLLISWIFAALALSFFQRLRTGFADVL